MTNYYIVLIPQDNTKTFEQNVKEFIFDNLLEFEKARKDTENQYDFVDKNNENKVVLTLKGSELISFIEKE